MIIENYCPIFQKELNKGRVVGTEYNQLCNICGCSTLELLV